MALWKYLKFVIVGVKIIHHLCTMKKRQIFI